VAKPTNPVRFGLTWVSRTDALTLADRAKTLRRQQNEILGRLNNRLDAFGEGLEGSTKYMDRAQRAAFRSKANSGKRSELAQESKDIRTTYVRQLAGLAEDAKRAEALYTGSIPYLMLKTLGSERRALYQQQIAAAGPAELRAMAALAASNPSPNLDLAAALAAHVGAMKTADRPFTTKDLAEHLVGEELREIRLALASAQLSAVEGLDADTRFETGAVNANRKMELAILRKRIAKELLLDVEAGEDEALDTETEEAAV
jgi:hypothetical protein